jgi:hypothetical protein
MFMWQRILESLRYYVVDRPRTHGRNRDQGLRCGCMRDGYKSCQLEWLWAIRRRFKGAR